MIASIMFYTIYFVWLNLPILHVKTKVHHKDTSELKEM